MFILIFKKLDIQTFNSPANICWSWRRLQNVSWRRLQEMSWRRLEDVLSVTFFGLPRHVQDVLKTSWKNLEKTSWRRLGRQKIVTLKTFSRRLGEKQNVYQRYRYLTNLNVYIFDLTNLYLTNPYPTNLRQMQNALIRKQ